MPPLTVIEQIRDVWGGYDDFQDGGYNYVAFVIHQDLREMEAERWADTAGVREMSDVAINALRALDELSPAEPRQTIRYRLQSQEDKGQENIIEKYQSLFDDRL